MKLQTAMKNNEPKIYSYFNMTTIKEAWKKSIDCDERFCRSVFCSIHNITPKILQKDFEMHNCMGSILLHLKRSKISRLDS